MTAEIPGQPDAPPDPVERGRYAVFGTPEGGWAISRAGPLCDRCADCGCGAQSDPIMVPGFVVAMMTGDGNGKIPAPMRMMLGKVLGRGGS